MSRPSSHYARGSAFMLTPGALPAAAPSTSIPCWSPVPTDWDVRTDDARVSGARKLDLGPRTGQVENVRFGPFSTDPAGFVSRVTSGLPKKRLSCASPAVSPSRTGRPLVSTTACILLVSPPRDRLANKLLSRLRSGSMLLADRGYAARNSKT